MGTGAAGGGAGSASSPQCLQGVGLGTYFECREGTRLGNAIPLPVIDADSAQLFEDLLALDGLRDGPFAHRVTHIVNGFDKCLTHRVLADFLDEDTIDLDQIDSQVLEISKGRDPAAEIIECE